MTLVPTSQHREFHPRSLLKSNDDAMRGYLPFCCQPGSTLGHDRGARHQSSLKRRIIIGPHSSPHLPVLQPSLAHRRVRYKGTLPELPMVCCSFMFPLQDSECVPGITGFQSGPGLQPRLTCILTVRPTKVHYTLP